MLSYRSFPSVLIIPLYLYIVLVFLPLLTFQIHPKQYPHGTAVNVLDTSNVGWYEAVLPNGKRGYMDARFLRHSRTEATFSETVRSVAESRPLRDQPFCIYRVVPEPTRVTVYARQIFYDLLDNIRRLPLRKSPAHLRIAKH